MCVCVMCHWVASDSWQPCGCVKTVVSCPQQPCAAPVDSGFGGQSISYLGFLFPCCFVSPVCLSFPRTPPSQDVPKGEWLQLCHFCLQRRTFLQRHFRPNVPWDPHVCLSGSPGHPRSSPPAPHLRLDPATSLPPCATHIHTQWLGMRA